jgi:hypothetical protein
MTNCRSELFWTPMELRGGSLTLFHFNSDGRRGSLLQLQFFDYPLIRQPRSIGNFELDLIVLNMKNIVYTLFI